MPTSVIYCAQLSQAIIDGAKHRNVSVMHTYLHEQKQCAGRLLLIIKQI